MLSDGLKKIGGYSFQDCTSLQSITIPSTVDDVDDFAFHSCTNLRDVVLHDGVKRIKTYAFIGCTSLERITIPSSVTEIGQYAFYNCGSLREIVLHNEEAQIALLECISLERFSFPSLSARLDNIIQAGQRDIEPKMDDISAVEWRGGELSIPAVRRQREDQWGEMENVVEIDKEKLNKIKGLISYYEMKEATTLFELALWKAKIDQEEVHPINREAYRIEVPGPVKDTILQFLG